jgi:transcriptional regulator with XRE-family HTH domain
MKSGFSQAFGLRMRQRRIAMNMTEELAAAALGVSTQRYQAMEAGENSPTLDQLRDAGFSLQAQASSLFATLSQPAPSAQHRH